MSSIAKDADKKTIEDIFAEIGKKISDKYTKTDIFIRFTNRRRKETSKTEKL